MLYLRWLRDILEWMLSGRVVYSANAQGKYLVSDFLFTKEMFKSVVGIDNVVNFEEIIDTLSEWLVKPFPALRC